MSGSGISWAICKSAPRCRQITTPVPHHSVFYRPDAFPAAQPTASKHWRPKDHRTSYTTASARQCKCGRFSLPQYSKQEWPLFTAALEQTSNVTTARNVGRSSSRVRRRASGLPYPASGRRSWLPPFPSLRRIPSPRFDTCTTAPETWPLPAVKRAHPPGAHDKDQFLHVNEVRI